MSTASPHRAAAPPGWPGQVMGELRLGVDVRGARSVAVSQFHAGALRVLRPLYLDQTGQVCYVVINPGGGYLTGDDYLLDIDVRPDASLLLTTQSATKIYRTPGGPARQHTNIRVGAGALLESIPDQLIAYQDATYVQTAVAEVDPDGTYVAAEVVTPGWAPDGTPFRYEKLLLRTEITRPGSDVPVLIDALLLQPETMAMSDLGGLESRTHVGSLLVVDRRVDAELVREVHDMADRRPAMDVGVSLAPGPALVLRVLGENTDAITDLLLDVDALLRHRWFGRGRIDLRKQ